MDRRRMNRKQHSPSSESGCSICFPPESRGGVENDGFNRGRGRFLPIGAASSGGDMVLITTIEDIFLWRDTFTRFVSGLVLFMESPLCAGGLGVGQKGPG